MNRSQLIASLDYTLNKVALLRKHKEKYETTGKCSYCLPLSKKNIVVEAPDYDYELVCSICGAKYKESTV